DYIHDCLLEDETFNFKGTSNVIFLSRNPIAEDFVKSKKGKSYEMTQLTFHLNTNIVKIELDQKKAGWLLPIMQENSIEKPQKITLQQLKTDFEKTLDDFELFWFSKPIQQLKENGIILSV
ncbi:MAG: radical SAM protein, partial [Kaistella sp.]